MLVLPESIYLTLFRIYGRLMCVSFKYGSSEKKIMFQVCFFSIIYWETPGALVAHLLLADLGRLKVTIVSIGWSMSV